MIGAGILSFNDCEKLKVCINSLKEKAAGQIPIMTVWDNGSTENNVQYIKEKHPDIFLLDQKINLGGCQGLNGMITYFREYHPSFGAIFLCNQDLKFVTNNFIAKMVETMQAHQDCGAVAWPISNVGFPVREDGLVSEVMAQAVLYRMKMFHQVGLYDSRFFYYSADSEFFQRMNSYGWHTYLVLNQGQGYEHHHGTCKKYAKNYIAGKDRDSHLWTNVLSQKYNKGVPWSWK